jgi:hypothetical protein
MAIKKDAGRQPITHAELVINFGDPVAYGAAEDAIELPPGARVVGGDVTVLTPFNSATSNAIGLGDVTTPTRYAAAVDLKAAAGTRVALTLPGFVTTPTERFIRANLAQVGGVPTAGSVRISVAYVQNKRSWFTQG